MTEVLVIEDDPQITWLLRILLEQLGLEVSSATTGTEGLERWRGGNPDLVILDVRLPGMDGFEILCAQRAQGSPAKVLMLTGEHGTRERALAAGADDHLRKPFVPTQLIACVDRLARH